MRSTPLRRRLATLALTGLAASAAAGRETPELLLHETTATIAGRQVHRLKRIDAATGRVVVEDRDAGGRRVDVSAWRRLRRDPVRPALAARLAAAPEGLHPVVLWLAVDAVPDVAEREAAGIDHDDLRDAELDRARADRCRAAARPIVGLLLALGVVDASAQEGLPVVRGSLDLPRIELLARLPEVDAIYLDRPAAPELDVATRAIKAHRTWNRGIDGNVRVAVIEVGGRVPDDHPALPANLVQDDADACGAATLHTTAVVGVVTSRDGTFGGVAPNAKLRVAGSCGGLSGELLDRIADARAWGARVMNLSWGSDTAGVPGFLDRAIDEESFRYKRMMVKSAGNAGAMGCSGGDDGWVSSPGLGYNVITVGSYDDDGTVSAADDAMATCSSWRDPLSESGDREKPEIAAPGTAIATLIDVDPWVGGSLSGTSLAAPMVTGTVALLIDRDARLKRRPEALKAILLASATANVEGDPARSELDGAGGIRADRADDVARFRNGGWGSLGHACDDADLIVLETFELRAGKRTRVALVWGNDPDDPAYEDRPSADFDLVVRRNGAGIVATSAAFDPAWEIVEFVAPADGTYRIVADRVRCDRDPRRLAWAWWSSP